MRRVDDKGPAEPLREKLKRNVSVERRGHPFEQGRRYGAGRLAGGAIYDWTDSYAAALINGIGWNIVNMAIVIWLLQQTLGRSALASR